MPNIAVRKFSATEIPPPQLQEEIQTLSERIRARAYELFLARGGAEGNDMYDWLAAERELAPKTQINESDLEFQARIDVTGIDSKAIEVIATASAVMLEAPREAKLLQRLEFPTAIDPARVTAKLDKGVLQVSCPKRMQTLLTAAQAG